MLSLIPKPKQTSTFKKKPSLFVTGKTYVVFSAYGEGFPIAKRLQDEGNDVIACLCEDLKFTNPKKDWKDYKPEDPEMKKRRMSLYDGMLDKRPIDEVVEMLKELTPKQKENYRLFFDMNILFYYAEQLEDSGIRGNLSLIHI